MTRRTASDKILRDETINTSKIQNTMDIKVGLLSIIYKCFDNKTSGAAIKPNQGLIKKGIFWRSNFKNVYLEGAIFKIYFLREQFSKYVFWGSDFESVFLREQICENVIFERVVLKMSFLKE